MSYGDLRAFKLWLCHSLGLGACCGFCLASCAWPLAKQFVTWPQYLVLASRAAMAVAAACDIAPNVWSWGLENVAHGVHILEGQRIRALLYSGARNMVSFRVCIIETMVLHKEATSTRTPPP